MGDNLKEVSQPCTKMKRLSAATAARNSCSPRPSRLSSPRRASRTSPAAAPPAAPTVIAEVIQHTGRTLGDLAADGGFAVQNAHGVFLQTLLAGLAQFLPTALEVGAQRLVVLGAAGGASDGIDGKGQILQPEGLHTLPRQRNDLGIGDGLGGAVAFHAELMELAEASALGFFIAEAVEHITDLEGQGIAQKTVFNGGAADTGEPFLFTLPFSPNLC